MGHPLKPMAALLVLRNGPDAGARFVIENAEVLCGRDPDCDVFLEDVTVSRRHARIRRAGSGFEIEDADSLNGTYLNGERVRKSFLTSGDIIQIGKFRLTFFESPAPA
jgi:pSer/pThr/pTyr-binding forkhead associated (FHA) protein